MDGEEEVQTSLPVPTKKKILSRRDFMKASAIVSLAAALAELKADTVLSPENELNSKTLVLDFFDVDKAQDRFITENFPPDFDVDKTLREMGVTDPKTREGLRQAVPKTEDQARLFMMKAFEVIYKDHGKDILGVMKNTSEFLGVKSDSNDSQGISVIDAIEMGELEFDDINNPTLHRTIDPEEIDEIISKTDASIVNMSLELGDGMMTYELYEQKMKNPELGREMPYERPSGNTTKYYDYVGNEISNEIYDEIVKKANERVVKLLEPSDRTIVSIDGYAGEETENNLRMLVDVSRKYPQRIFFAAGGNPSYLEGRNIPDIREARKKLEEEGVWPNNLMIVGFQAEESGFIAPASLGADIYVADSFLEEIGFFGASSYATPVVSEISKQLVASGLETPKKIKNKLRDLSDLNTVHNMMGDNESIDYAVLNIKKVADYIEVWGK